MKRFAMVLLLSVWASVLWAQSADPLEGIEAYLPLFFAYDNPCELCRDDADFYEAFNRGIRDVPDAPVIGFYVFNVFKQADRAAFDKLCGEMGIESASLAMPALIIGDEYLAGEAAVYAGARDLFLRQKDRAVIYRVKQDYGAASAPAPVPVPTKPPADFPVSGPNNSILVVLVTSGCENCEKAKVLLGKLPREITLADGSVSIVDIYYFSIAEDAGYLAAGHFFNAYKVPGAQQFVPTIFYTGGYLSGYEAIERGLNTILVSGAARGFVYPDSGGAQAALAWRQLPAIILAGLLGGINPCSISMLLLLLSLLSSKSSRVLPLGLTYVASRMITYLALGIGLFSLGSLLNADSFLSIADIIRIAVIVLSLLLCALNLADFVNARRENYGAIKVQLPAALRRFNHRLINKVAGADTRFLMVGIFLLGVAVSAGEFLCTGQIYVATILYLLRTGGGGRSVAFVSLLCYTAAASIPPVVLVIVCYKGKQALALSEFARQKMPLIKIANAVLFAAFAVIAFLFF
jgi:hypothetical protein